MPDSPVLQAGQGRLTTGIQQRDHVLPRKVAFSSFLTGCLLQCFIQPRHFFFRIDNDCQIIDFTQDILAELRLQGRHLGVDLPHSVLLRLSQSSSGPDKVKMVLLQQAQRLRFESQLLSLIKQGLYPGEQGTIQQNGVTVSSQLGRELLLQRPDLVISMRAAHAEKYPGHPVEQLTGQFQRNNRVFKIRVLTLTGDGLNFG